MGGSRYEHWPSEVCHWVKEIAKAKFGRHASALNDEANTRKQAKEYARQAAMLRTQLEAGLREARGSHGPTYAWVARIFDSALRSLEEGRTLQNQRGTSSVLAVRVHPGSLARPAWYIWLVGQPSLFTTVYSENNVIWTPLMNDLQSTIQRVRPEGLWVSLKMKNDVVEETWDLFLEFSLAKVTWD